MAKIFEAPDGFSTPSYSKFMTDGKFDHVGMRNADDKYISDLKEWCLNRVEGKQSKENMKFIGEVIGFPVADGQALYMVAAMSPLQLIHLELGDAWHFQYAHLLTAKEVKEKVNSNKAMAKLFSKEA